jgi:hypothetical protein
MLGKALDEILPYLENLLPVRDIYKEVLGEFAC